jgi:hypothetical protein
MGAAAAFIGLNLPLVTIGAAPAPATPTPEPTPRTELKEIGRVRARTPYCVAFQQHFDASVHALKDQDATIGAVDFTMGDVTKTFNELGGDLRRVDDRKKLAAYADQLMAAIPPAQTEINQLRQASTLTTDPELAKYNHDLAAQLQKALDRQKQIATDTQSLVRSLMEYDTAIQPANQGVLPGGYDPQTVGKPPDMLNVKKYTRIDELRDRIGDAEGNSADIASQIVQKC